MIFKEKKESVTKLIFSLDLDFTDEDEKQISKLIDSYFRKRTNFVNSSIENIAGGLLWVYSRINFLFENNYSWSQKNIAGMLGIKPKTVSNIASRIMDSLRISLFDERFARREIAENSPFNNFFMTSSGFILHKDQIEELISRNKFRDEDDDEENEGDKETITNKNKQLGEYFK